ncbi:type II toxin-antitoxin system death-on-curing family toxin [Desulfosporosinus fructosivorans]|uniref:Type II toxin-antitoxin system death-on-curing family toxin n=1 Tax=Desulfosporosinus fructosivorans TaxID=2018669 RepID=A0A4Z0R202_9FIRM|nr:type II toxin-antitoxin system death-on-curing family toxin [Desulfosporosinus fructosivorans]TGE36183.1 type II toxin-antitoxin system death-on-curing family toxin [Desulfosporosinus fructosivorans]
MIKFLRIENVLMFHGKIIKETGGSAGIRDRGLIESALNRGFMTYDGKDLYPSIIEKISVIAYSLISNHGFVDGNKRIGVAVMLIMLKMNNVKVCYTQKELIELGLKTAEGFMREKDILTWIKVHIED